MSAKEFHHKSPPVIPVLKDVPPEIWSTVFQHAAGAGAGIYEYEMTPSEHADFLRGEDKSLRQSFCANFRTRNYLSRVNKAWYAMTAPFLFEYIHLVNGRKVGCLCEAILRSKQAGSSGESIPSFGWWTKRLDVHIRDSGDGSYTPLVYSQLTEMLACFPNLRILSIHAVGNGFERRKADLSLLNAVSVPKSLKAMRWRYEQVSFPVPLLIDTWTAFLERHPNLQSIRGPNIVKAGGNDVSKSLRALWPLLPGSANLGIIPISGAIKLTDCPLPNLSSFHCQRPWFLADQYLQVRHISVLHLKWIHSATDLSDALAGQFPNLVEIDLELLTWEIFTESFSILFMALKSLKTLGLSVDQPQIPGKELRSLLDDVFPLFNQSSITTIRFLLEKNVKALRRHPQLLQVGTQRLASLGLALQDFQYQPLLRLD